MIIECINCNKKFNVDQNLIPENGRQIQCGSCNHRWHYKIENFLSEPLDINEKINQKENYLKNNKSENFEIRPNVSKIESKNEEIVKKLNNENFTESEKKAKGSNLGNFFSYFIVFIISIIALFILVDTLKSPLINAFPALEIILFNLFETLKDIKLFIIDLT
jgi:predicted Zn finger-like uncharacterized protein